MAQCSSPEELVAIQSVLHPIVAHAVTAGDAATRDWSTMSLPSMPGLAPRECIEEDESDNGASLMNTSDPNSDSGQGGNGRKPRASALARFSAVAQREASEGAAVSGDGKLPLAAWPTSFGDLFGGFFPARATGRRAADWFVDLQHSPHQSRVWRLVRRGG